jgi:ABC-type Mn2+/Zn2+ transport system ATPase subunit
MRAVTFAYPGGPPVLRDVNLGVGRGEFVAVAGPNGGGKTTLMRLALGLERPDRGQVLLFGQPAHAFRERERLG